MAYQSVEKPIILVDAELCSVIAKSTSHFVPNFNPTKKIRFQIIYQCLKKCYEDLCDGAYFAKIGLKAVSNFRGKSLSYFSGAG